MGLLGGSSAFLGLMALGSLVLLMVGKILTALELLGKEQIHRKSMNRITELEDDLETSRSRYLTALKAEGVGKNEVSQMKIRLARLKQQMEQIEMSEIQEQARRHQEKEKALEMAVLQALGGPSQRDSHFHRVMKIITQLIDVAKLESNDDIIQAVQAKLAQMNKRDGLDTPSEAPARPQPEEAETKAQPTPEEQSVRISNRASRVRAAVDSAGTKKAPTET